MLRNISFQNFYSFLEQQILYLDATDDSAHEDSVLKKGDIRLLPVAAVYGANASGKTNALYAIMHMQYMLRTSVQLNPGDKLPHIPFHLTLASRDKPTTIEAQFFVKDTDTLYRYGFSYDDKTIHEEWLYGIHDEEESMYFERGKNINGKITIACGDRFPEGEGKENTTPENRLFLSLVAQLNGEISRSILNYWTYCINTLFGSEQGLYAEFSYRIIHMKLPGHVEIMNLLAKLDTSIRGIEMQERPTEQKGHLVPTREVRFYATHNVYSDNGEVISKESFPFQFESMGTQKLIDISGPIVTALRDGTILVVDELEAKLHPHLTRYIIRRFMNPETNPNGAQLIFSTHDTVQLNCNLLRRDQIWLVAKDEQERSQLYSLAEYGTLPQSTLKDLQQEYLRGRFGAIPNIQ